MAARAGTIMDTTVRTSLVFIYVIYLFVMQWFTNEAMWIVRKETVASIGVLVINIR